jgi:hypothetical protein
MKKYEAKYRGSIERRSGVLNNSSIVSELMCIKQALANLNIKVEEPMKMFCDNQPAKHITTNLVFHDRTKHMKLIVTLLDKNIIKGDRNSICQE